jgi:uncharacterized protein (DUF302 family)
VGYHDTVRLETGYDDAVSRTREALSEQGFGVLTEIDVQQTLKDKRGVEMERYVILGACNPELAHQALEVDRSIGVLLPCNVVVREEDGGTTVQILDAQLMASLSERADLQPLADEATRRLDAVRTRLAG